MNALKRALLIALVVIAAPPAFAQDADYAALVAAYERDLAAYEQELARKPDNSITFHGLTGLFHVISPDTLQKGHVSFGMLHRNYDRKLTDVDVNDTTAAFAVGVSDRVEVGFAIVGNRQTDFDDAFSPVFYNNLPHPVTTIENGGGDAHLNLKLALARMEDTGNGLALISRVKLPIAKEEAGRGTGGVDFTLGAAGGIVRNQVGLFANAGYTLVGDASDEIGGIDLADMFNWGLGFELGSRHWLSGIAEMTGEHFVSVPSALPEQEDNVDLTLGFKLGGAKHSGFTLGGAYVYNLTPNRDRSYNEREHGWIGEISYTSAPPPPVMPVKPPPPNHPPTVSLSANPPTVYPSYSTKPNKSTVTARAEDPDGDSLSYTWSTSGGSVSGSGPSVVWSPPENVEQGSYTVTVRVSDGRGGQAEASTPIQVEPDPEWFEGRVQFEFDRYDLDDEDKAVISRASKHLQKFPELRLMIEGHACYIATEEYNLVLGQQRADAISKYMAEVGVDASRVRTISYGETRPWQDNSREITRRLNRRGEFRFRFTR